MSSVVRLGGQDLDQAQRGFLVPLVDLPRPWVNPIQMGVVLWLSMLLNLSAQEVRKPTCAVLTLDARGGVSVSDAEILSDRFAVEFDRLHRFRMVSRSRMKDVLEAQNFSMSAACASDECAVEAGRMLGIRYLVYGSIGQIGEVYSINSFIVDVESGAQVRGATCDSYGSIEEALTVLMAVNAHQLLRRPIPDHLEQRWRRTPEKRVSPEESSPDDPIYMGSPSKDSPVYESPPPSAVARPVYFSSSHQARMDQHEQSVYFGPRIGLSTYIGLAGAECQFGHVGLSAGYIPDGFAAGVKLYGSRYRSSWYLGACYMTRSHEDSGASYSETSDKQLAGVGLGYRWRTDDGWEYAFGIGVGQMVEQYYFSIQGRVTDDETEETIVPIGEVSIGYSF